MCCSVQHAFSGLRIPKLDCKRRRGDHVWAWGPIVVQIMASLFDGLAHLQSPRSNVNNKSGASCYKYNLKLSLATAQLVFSVG